MQKTKHGLSRVMSDDGVYELKLQSGNSKYRV